jgi:hypothetical protein
MEIVTAECGRVAHREFVLEADPSHVPEASLRDIGRTLEQMVAGRSVFEPGQTFQIGWMLTLVQPLGDNRLTLAEPDMRTIPIRWVRGITHTLRQMRLQSSMLDSFGLREEADIPGAQHSLLVCNHYADPEFFMQRTALSGEADTGWFVACTRGGHDHNDPENLRRISMYEAYVNQRAIQPFAVFPFGSQIFVSPEDGLEVWRRGAPLNVMGGSLLDRWFAKEGRRTLPPEARL